VNNRLEQKALRASAQPGVGLTFMKKFCQQNIFSKIIILSLLGLQACVAIPTPWGKDRFSKEDVSIVMVGVSNRNEVLEKFGKPDVIWETGQKEYVYVYKWERLRALVVVAGGYQAAVAALKTDEALLILFDEANCIKRIGKATKPPFESYGSFLTHWLGQDAE